MARVSKEHILSEIRHLTAANDGTPLGQRKFAEVVSRNQHGKACGIHLPEKHDLIHVIETDDPSGTEAYWHKRFGRKQTNGEWFVLSPDVAAFVRRTYM
ncbi:MAG TPA: GIY-YIG nuclease family protein [Jatrophihabitans sp.]